MKKLIGFLLVFFGAGSLTFAQYGIVKDPKTFRPGYVVDQQGDTLKGYTFTGNSNVHFRRTLDDKTMKISHNDVKAFTFGSDSFYNIDGKMFLHKIHGKVNLYIREKEAPPTHSGGGWSKTTFFAVKRTDEKEYTLLYTNTGVKNRKNYFKKTALAYFADHPETVAKIRNKTYHAENIKKMVTDYNLRNAMSDMMKQMGI